MDVDVGKRLKEIRSAHGLSQRQLADRSGVTNGTISMIEQNRTSPSVGSLKKVLEGIPVTLSEFFQTVEEEPKKYFFNGIDLTELNPSVLGKIGSSGNVGAMSLRQVGNAPLNSLQILHECYPPDADTGEDMLSHQSEEGGIVLSGEIEITVEDQVKILRQGDAYLFDSTLRHRFRNIGTEDCIVVSACTPPSF
jgi:transcriptional regulator with XRE-family HTH domain